MLFALVSCACFEECYSKREDISECLLLSELYKQLYNSLEISERLQNLVSSIPRRPKKTNTGDTRKNPYITKLENQYQVKLEAHQRKVEENPNYQGKAPRESNFMVGDLETVALKESADVDQRFEIKYEEVGGAIHVPYAAAFMLIDHDKVKENNEGIRSLPKSKIETFYSSEYKIHAGENFCHQSVVSMKRFIERIIEVARRGRHPLIIYFHNLRFDGIILANHIIQYHRKGLDIERGINIREGNIYEIAVYGRVAANTRRRLLCKMRCSLHLLPCSLGVLAEQICPDLDGKGDMDHANVTPETIIENAEAYQNYLKHDVFLLAHILVRVQKIFYEKYKIDIVSKMTIAAMAFTIWRISSL